MPQAKKKKEKKSKNTIILRHNMRNEGLTLKIKNQIGMTAALQAREKNSQYHNITGRLQVVPQ